MPRFLPTKNSANPCPAPRSRTETGFFTHSKCRRPKILPDTPGHVRQELSIQTTLGPALTVTRGFAAPEVEQTYLRALELCRQLEVSFQLFGAMRGWWVFYLTRTEYQRAQELGEQLLDLAHCVQNAALLLEASRALGIILFYFGESVPARTHSEQAVALYDPRQHHSYALLVRDWTPG